MSCELSLQVSACGFLKNLATGEHRAAVRNSAAIPKLIATAERNKSSSDVQNQARTSPPARPARPPIRPTRTGLLPPSTLGRSDLR